MFAQAKQVIPGGVNPCSCIQGGWRYPIFIQKAKGAYLFDEDGNQYIDFISSWGPLILGHGYKPVLRAAKSGQERHFIWNPDRTETNIAELALSMHPTL